MSHNKINLGFFLTLGLKTVLYKEPPFCNDFLIVFLRFNLPLD